MKPSAYVSGHCDVSRHTACAGHYGATSCTCDCHRVNALMQQAVDYGTRYGVSDHHTRDLWAHLRSGTAWQRMTEEDALRAVRLTLDLGWRPAAAQQAHERAAS